MEVGDAYVGVGAVEVAGLAAVATQVGVDDAVPVEAAVANGAAADVGPGVGCCGVAVDVGAEEEEGAAVAAGDGDDGGVVGVGDDGCVGVETVDGGLPGGSGAVDFAVAVELVAEQVEEDGDAGADGWGEGGEGPLVEFKDCAEVGCVADLAGQGYMGEQGGGEAAFEVGAGGVGEDGLAGGSGEGAEGGGGGGFAVGAGDGDGGVKLLKAGGDEVGVKGGGDEAADGGASTAAGEAGEPASGAAGKGGGGTRRGMGDFAAGRRSALGDWCLLKVLVPAGAEHPLGGCSAPAGKRLGEFSGWVFAGCGAGRGGG